MILPQRRSPLAALLFFAFLFANHSPFADIPDAYTPREILGWTVYVNNQLIDEDKELGDRALELARAQLYHINRALPAKALAKLHTVKIWLDREAKQFPGCVYHPSADWLRENGFDPQKAQSVHIANATNFLNWSYDQPAMILHEMAHAYHHQVLGYDYPDIQNAYRRAVESKAYESVLYCRGGMQKAYALNNDQEYFAELSEAFFSVNDYYPFVRAEIEQIDPEMFAVLKKVWGE